MASRTVHIADYAAAIAAWTIPGTFRKNRTVFEFPPVETFNSRGARLAGRSASRSRGGLTQAVLGRATRAAGSWA